MNWINVIIGLSILVGSSIILSEIFGVSLITYGIMILIGAVLALKLSLRS